MKEDKMVKDLFEWFKMLVKTFISGFHVFELTFGLPKKVILHLQKTEKLKRVLEKTKFLLSLNGLPWIIKKIRSSVRILRQSNGERYVFMPSPF